ncbi:unnamed protein product [Caenorhabditis bovis]|uniref:Uncharacterized protein n=1 Tax=Caenorhabditis bovis TaxID=2654633 RepID=A0A8S1EY23_9PELO|nr:unnamed protein product [Caenorhabditis bovis]
MSRKSDIRVAPLNYNYNYNCSPTFQLFHISLIDARLTRRHVKRSNPGCASSANAQTHEAFSRLINRLDDEMFSYVQPEANFRLDFKPIHNHKMSPANRDCHVPNDATDGPILERSVCPYHYRLNYNEKINGRKVFCEPMYYNMRIMEFDESCDKFVEKIERIALACVTNSISDASVTHQTPVKPPSPV